MRTKTFLAAGPTRIDLNALLAGLAAAALALVYAAIRYRPLVADSSCWLVNLLTENRVFYDGNLMRQFDTVNQLPALALTLLAGHHDWTRAIVWTWGLSYNLQPFVSLALCWIICRRNRVENAFLFPVISFATATMMTLGAPATVMPTTLSVFWPLFLWVRHEKPSPLWYAGVLVGSVCLAFTHEAAFMLFGVLFLSIGRLNAVSCLFWAGSVWLAWRAMIQGYALSYGFRASMHAPWGAFTWSLIASACGLAAISEWARRARRNPERLVWACGVFVLLVFAVVSQLQPAELFSVRISDVSRTAAGPVAALVAFMALRQTSLTGPLWRPMSQFVAALLCLGAAYDLTLTESWSKGVRAMEAALDAPGGNCMVLEGAEYERVFAPAGFSVGYFPQLSILLQRLKRPRRIIGIRSYAEEVQHIDFCRMVSEGWIPAVSMWPLTNRGYLDFTGLYAPAGNAPRSP